MKIKLLLITAFSIVSMNAMAQQDFAFDDVKNNEPKLAARIGGSAGFNLSSISDNSSSISSGLGMRPGFNAGVVANLRFCKRNERSSAKTGLLAFQPEIRYTTMGGNSEEYSIGTGYLMVPLMFQVYPAKNIYLEVGPEFAMNLSHTPDVKSKFSAYNFKKIRIPQFSETGFGSFVGLFSCFCVYKQ